MPVTIGGDGSISVPIARAVARCYSDLVALHIDSHTDVMRAAPPTSTPGEQFTHIAKTNASMHPRPGMVGIRGTTSTPGVLKHTRDLG